MLDRHGFSGAFVFCMDEHDREPAFCVPNDRTLAHAERSAAASCRSSASTSASDPSRRRSAPRPSAHAGSSCIRGRRRSPSTTSASARSSSSRWSDPSRSSSTAGAGCRPSEDTWRPSSSATRAFGSSSRTGIVDMAGLAGRLGGIPGVYFDTSVWSAVDLLLYRQVSPSRSCTRPTTRTGRAELATALRPDGEARQLRRPPAPLDARRERAADRRQRAATAADGAEGRDLHSSSRSRSPASTTTSRWVMLGPPARWCRSARARRERVARAGGHRDEAVRIEGSLHGTGAVGGQRGDRLRRRADRPSRTAIRS